ncbi:toll-like receptor 2 [Ixodes scapularis]
MPRVALLPALLWVLTSWALDVTTAWRVREAHSHSKTRNLDSVYMNPQSSVALRVGAAGTLLSSWILNDCNIQHFSDGGLLVTGHKCEDIPIVNMTSWPVPATEIALYHTSVTSLQPNAYHAYGPISQVTKLEIIQNKIYAIKPHAFNGFPNVTFLSLSDNPIKFLSSESFRGLDSLKVLVLFRTRLHEFSTVIASVNPGVLPKLEILNLGNTALHRIDEHDLVPMENSSLKHIQFHLCDNLAYIHPQALKPLKHLEGFYLRDNLNMKVENIIDVISNITQETFRIIDVSQPVYKAVPYRILESVARTAAEVIIFIRMTDYTVTKDSFPPMNRVKCLVLESGKIREFKANALQNLPNLEEVSFRRNLFLGVPPGLLAPRIKFLDLSGYDRGFVQLDLPDYVFSKMVNLREMYLRYKALPSLTEFTFWGLKNLETLDMKQCSIDSLPQGVFHHLTNLKHLDLSDNPVFRIGSTFSPHIFQGMTNLNSLILSNTKISDMAKAVSFSDLTSLEYLDVSNNSIVTVPKEVFISGVNLKHLDLSRNIIDRWSPLPSSLMNLQILDLSSNRLRHFRTDVINGFNRLRTLDVSKNPFACTCGITPFLEWTKTSNVTLINLAYEELHSCSEPRDMAGRHIRSVLPHLQKICKPTILISIMCVAILVLVFVILLVSGYIYRRRFELWLQTQSAMSSSANRAYIYDAFVSYSNSDTQWVISRLLPQLECSTISNLKLCVYDRDFVAGRNISECILDSIKHSRKIILVLSNSFLQSPWCRFETDLAQYTLLEENRDAFILLKISRLDETLLSPKLNYLLKTRVHLSWTQTPKEELAFFSKLHKALVDTRPKSHLEKSIFPTAHTPSVVPFFTRKLGIFRKLKKSAGLV